MGLILLLTFATKYVGEIRHEFEDCTQRTDAWYAKYYTPVQVAMDEMQSNFTCGLGEKAGGMTRVVSDATLMHELANEGYSLRESEHMLDRLRYTYGEAHE